MAPEIQLGIGCSLTDYVNLSLSYQGIYGGSADYRVNSITEVGNVDNIPGQQGLLLGLSFNI
jgi:hypothetical protein